MACRRNSWAAVICAAVLTLCFKSPAQEQQKNSVVSSSAVQPIDPRAEIDELIKQSNEQINLKGQFQKGAEFAQQAFALSQQLDDKRRTLEAMMYLASAYYYQGRMLEALELSEKVAALAKEVGNRKTLSQALNRMAAVLGELGRFEESLSYLYQCMDVAREQRDQAMQHIVLINIGELYIRVGDPDKAEGPLLESLRIAHELKSSEPGSNPSKKATELSLKFLGEMEAAREHYKPALTYLQRVRESRPENEQAIIGLLNSMAAIYQRIGKPQKAVELLDEARDRAKKSGSVSYSITLADLGESQESLGHLNEALASENLALAEVRKNGGNADYEWQIERRIGHIDHGLGRDEEALTHYRNSIHAVERLRASALNTEPGKAGFTSRSQAVYAETADLLYALGHKHEALEMAERGRARGFLDMLAYSRTEGPAELTPEQREREQALLVRISGIEKELWRDDLSAHEKQLRKRELASAEEDLEAFQLAVRRDNPRYASIHYPEPMNVRQIQDKLLDQQTALVEFQLGEKRSFVWAVAMNRVDAAVLPGRKDIEGQVSAYRKLLTDRASALTVGESLPEIERRGRQLYELLLQPVAGALASHRQLVIIPDGTLEYLPFEGLVVGEHSSVAYVPAPKYLIERFAIIYAPSASSLAEIEAVHRKPVRTPKMLLAFADPVVVQPSKQIPPAAGEAARSVAPEPVTSQAEEYLERGFSWTQLPYTRAEALAISRLFPASQRRVYLGSAARAEILKAETVEDYRYIHFASHAFVDESSPARSGILLSPDANSANNSFLQVRDIMRLKLNADLVTLSACSTGLGKLVTGEGILGLTRAFFYAGATNLAASLWNVNDSATATLMAAFYRNLKQGLPKSSAMRQAKLSLLHSNDVVWHHPHYWAAFVLVGDGK